MTEKQIYLVAHKPLSLLERLRQVLASWSGRPAEDHFEVQS